MSRRARWIAVLGMLGVPAAGAGVAGCGSPGAPSVAAVTTFQLGAPTYVTVAPSTTTTTTTTMPPLPGSAFPTEQAYTVKAGDYLLHIAGLYCIDAQKVADYNGWEDGIDHALQNGDVIKIPAGACEKGTFLTVPTTVAESTTTTTIDPNAPGSYTVEKGDTLVGIATKLGTTVEDLINANGWEDGDKHVIYTGLKIMTPPHPPESTTTQVPSTSTILLTGTPVSEPPPTGTTTTLANRPATDTGTT